MRLHSLEITAFGPFAESVSVDFDALCDASVFLLCGDTGAGKTTVLDAVCFAFYGDVPSDRSRAKQLRSHHAPEGLAPRVVLEASVAGRRFRFTRSPAWQRPKRRGPGSTQEQARVLIEELVAGDGPPAWHSRTTRLDEAGHLVTELLGMSLGQFSQVVLLPQGQFDTFLGASSDDRHKVLTRLFRTSRFEDVERWLVDRRTTLRRAGEAHRERVTARLHRASEASGTELPDWVVDVETAAADGSLRDWVSAVTLDAEGALEHSRTALGEAARALELTSGSLEEGRRVADLRARHRRALATLERLAAGGDGARADETALEAARRADTVVPIARLVDEAAAKAQESTSAARDALAAATALVTAEVMDGLDDGALGQRARDATQRAAVARSFLPRARALVETERRQSDLDTQLLTLSARRDELAARAAALPARLAGLQASVTGLRAAAAQLPAARVCVVELGRLVSRIAILTELEFQVTDFTARRDQQRTVTVELRERLADLREQRLQGMAAELASSMAVGSDCPVCGSAEHPALARPVPGAATKDDEDELRDQIDTAEVLLETHADQVRGYQARLDALREELGDRSAEQALATLATAETELAKAGKAAADLVVAEAELAAAQEQERVDAATLRELHADLRIVEEQREHARRFVALVSGELAELLGTEGGAADLDALAHHSERVAQLFSRARDALVEQRRSIEQAERAGEVAAHAALDAGFDDLGTAVAAALPPEAISMLQTRIAARARAEAETAAVLADPDVCAAVELAPPDVEALSSAQKAATENHTSAATAHREAGRRHGQLASHVAALAAELAEWAPLRTELAVVRTLAELVEGKGADNTRQMRLSAYVLASRLGQVVAAANERLARMTDDRYALEHTAERGVGERRGGLSLVVRDQWTDDQRDPVTLSGGETFVVSLALALGLADVVTGEAGGVRIDTLFVDEGFGSLDSDTLELVMDTLDQLREGGRAVGVVSHVPELRTRIPTQLMVHKTRGGSRLEQRLAAG